MFGIWLRIIMAVSLFGTVALKTDLVRASDDECPEGMICPEPSQTDQDEGDESPVEDEGDEARYNTPTESEFDDTTNSYTDRRSPIYDEQTDYADEEPIEAAPSDDVAERTEY